jgi:hypothetical protein
MQSISSTNLPPQQNVQATSSNQGMKLRSGKVVHSNVQQKPNKLSSQDNQASLQGLKIQTVSASNKSKFQGLIARFFDLTRKIYNLVNSSSSEKQLKNEKLANMSFTTLNTLPTALQGHICIFLPLKDTISFAKATKSCKGAESEMLLNNDAAVNEILRKAKGKMSAIPEPLRTRVQEIAHSIQSLNLHDLPLTEGDINELVANFHALVELNVTKCDINDAGLQHIISLQSLVKLSLWGCKRIAPERFKELASLQYLQELDLGSTDIDDDGLKYLACLNRLKKLHLFNCLNITPDGLKELVSFKNLQDLNLAVTNINDERLQHITASLNGLIKLNLSWCSIITPEGIKELVSLQDLCLTGTSIDDDGLELLLLLNNLKKLDLTNCNHITFKGVKWLKQKLPTLQVEHSAKPPDNIFVLSHNLVLKILGASED